jgi:hypothetical protein
MGTRKIINVGYPTNNNDCASKLYVDNLIPMKKKGAYIQIIL